jgi:hypothetical protein
MVGTVSNAASAATAALSTSSTTSTDASLKAQLAAKQTELEQAKTDDEKATINAAIAKLKAQISAIQTTGTQQQQPTDGASDKTADTKDKNRSPWQSADKAAPEGKMSGQAMDVLMRMGPQGGMMPPGGRNSAGGQPDISKIYSEMDSDDNGKVTKDEFVSGRDKHMSEDDAGKIYASIDTENTGSITEDQFASSIKSHERDRPNGPPPGGMFQPFAGQSSSASDASTTMIIA